jgi:16S rRNA processing protein RimM
MAMTPNSNPPLVSEGQNKKSDAWLEIGTIVAPQGLKGELRVYPNSDFPERFETARTALVAATG